MAGAPQPNQPYGQQYQPMPQYAPQSAKRPGSMAPKIWGILLLVLGGMGALGWIVGLATLGGGGISGSTFAPGLTPEMKTEIDKMTVELVESMKGRWSFWANQVIEVAIFSLSILTKPSGVRMRVLSCSHVRSWACQRRWRFPVPGKVRMPGCSLPGV